MRTAVAIVLTALLTAGAVEAGAYLWLRHKGYVSTAGRARDLLDPFRGHRLNPEYEGYDSNGTRLHSSQGFRGERTFARMKAPGTYRIVLAGASTAYGLGSDPPYEPHHSLSNQQTLDAQLEPLLAARLGGERIEIINAATPAYRAFQQLVYLNESLLAYGPDLILVVEGHNDFYRAESESSPWMDYPYSSVLWVDGLNRRSATFTALVVARSLARFSWFFSGVETRLTTYFEAGERALFPHTDFLSQSTVPLPDHATFRRVARDNITRHYAQIAILGRLYGYRTIAVLQPELVLEDPAALGPGDRATHELTLGLTGTTRERSEALGRYPAWIAEAAAEVRTITGDGFAFFDHHRIADAGGEGERRLYYDYCHLSPEGTRRLAERIADDAVPFIVQGRVTPEGERSPASVSRAN